MRIQVSLTVNEAKKVIAKGIANVITSRGDLDVAKKVKSTILELTKQFPLYPG